jgi:hypothetical protein
LSKGRRRRALAPSCADEDKERLEHVVFPGNGSSRSHTDTSPSARKSLLLLLEKGKAAVGGGSTHAAGARAG